ncbi:Dual specificity protein phosphatase 4 [Hordeum vulgare]|nr:Dual specificity protein phosphatase 4 [Hordeum vulgare]
MEKDVRATTFQVVRYEKVQGQIKVVREGLEQPEFWDAFSSAPINSDSKMKPGKEQIDSPSRTGVGSQRVESYDSDFELVQKAIAGGVVPTFSSSGIGKAPMEESMNHAPMVSSASARDGDWLSCHNSSKA